ncbi:MAG: hypothetical protein EBV30_11050, partial [Actinobacteria bacterium]|nr:hypothetical protein [Actinomycetota bacterium]
DRATLEEARSIAYGTINKIRVAGAHYRSDIAALKQK